MPPVKQNRAKRGKKPHPTIVPPAQQQRILGRHIAGQSLRSISRDEHRNYATVANVILKSSEKLREYLEKSRADFLSMIPVGLATIKKGMQNGQTDLAYKFLTDAGVAGSSIVRNVDGSQVAVETSDPLSDKDQYFVRLAKMAHQRMKDFDLPDDTLEIEPSENALTVIAKTS
jgi:hypothetical protein